ncbi:MAG: hypothetical protein M1608_00840 [Candidatus Omnitrophica bacterium]|nr:hypothetical protein [Candidatus Omnitrophota bacterium]
MLAERLPRFREYRCSSYCGYGGYGAALAWVWPEPLAALRAYTEQAIRQGGGRHGDWGRDTALWLGRRVGRFSLAQLGGLSGRHVLRGGGQALSRFGKRLAKEPNLRDELREIDSKSSKIEM